MSELDSPDPRSRDILADGRTARSGPSCCCGYFSDPGSRGSTVNEPKRELVAPAWTQALPPILDRLRKSSQRKEQGQRPRDIPATWLT